MAFDCVQQPSMLVNEPAETSSLAFGSVGIQLLVLSLHLLPLRRCSLAVAFGVEFVRLR